MGELGSFAGASSLPQDVLVKTIGALFEEPRPDLGKWSAQHLTAFLSGYLEYFNSRIAAEKKLETVAQAASAMVVKMLNSPKG